MTILQAQLQTKQLQKKQLRYLAVNDTARMVADLQEFCQ